MIKLLFGHISGLSGRASGGKAEPEPGPDARLSGRAGLSTPRTRQRHGLLKL